jgi:hypothetical protein
MPELVTLGFKMILACCKAGDPYAVLCVAASARDRDQKNWAANIGRADLRDAKSKLEHLAYNDQNPDAMVLVGLDLREAGKDAEARQLFESAMRKVTGGEAFDIHSESTKLRRHVIEPSIDPLPIPAPWIALGTLLLEQAEPDLEAAKAVFEIGADDADDPLACFYLAECEDSYSDRWLENMTRAAASGHADAMCNLGNFYTHDKEELDRMVGPKGRQELKRLDSFPHWKAKGLHNLFPGIPGDLSLEGREAMAFEWFWIGYWADHKGSSLELARMLRGKVAWWAATEALKTILMDKEAQEIEEEKETFKKALVLSKVWLEEERKEGLSFMKNVLDSVVHKK